MLFKLSIRNMKKSYKDYTVYFFTLILGVCLFYMFSSIGSQAAMATLTDSKREIIKLLVTMLSGVSVGVSIILGFLIIYANGFLIRRRKKEFSVYMILGMGKRSISTILVAETLLIGMVSLIIGLFIGIFASQFMSILVAKMFEADMTKYKFIFSKGATLKTICYFGIIFILVLLFNVISITRYQLIDLMNAMKKNEKVKMKNPVLAVAVFCLSLAILAYAYYHVVIGYDELTEKKAIVMIVLGCIGTYLFFWSLSGFLLTMLQKCKKIYLKDLNAFILRQINSKINTMVVTITIICLMLFVTICVLSGGLSLNGALRDSLWSNTKADLCIKKGMTVSSDDSKVQKKNVKKTIKDSLTDMGFDLNLLKPGSLEVPVYQDEDLTYEELLLDHGEELKKQLPMFLLNTKLEIVSQSDYNSLAAIYDTDKVQLGSGEYALLCTYKIMKEFEDETLEAGSAFTIGGMEYKPAYKECTNGFLQMSEATTAFGIMVLPDEAFQESTGLKLYANYFVADYNASTKAGRQEIENQIDQFDSDDDYADFAIITKISIYDSSVGLSNIITFIALYLGIIFLITSAAILALKELSETSDNKTRYAILRKIGTDDKMIHKALFVQIGIFFFIPLLLAMIHSVFGIQFISKMFHALIGMTLVKPILYTVVFFIILYGGYFVATYFGSKRIIEE